MLSMPIDYMSSTVDLSGIDVVDADRRFIRQARQDVELQAHKMLEQGIESQVCLALCKCYLIYHITHILLLCCM